MEKHTEQAIEMTNRLVARKESWNTFLKENYMKRQREKERRAKERNRKLAKRFILELGIMNAILLIFLFLITRG